MKEFLERNLAAIIIATIFIMAFSSCYTVQEITRNDNPLTKCPWTE